MALTNALLKSMGIDGDQRDQIMAAHKEVCDSIIAERDELREKAAQVPDLKRQVEELEAQKPTEDWEAKYNEIKAEHESYVAQVAADKAKAEKESLYRGVLREAGVGERFIDDIMAVANLSELAVEGGKLADAEGVKAQVAEKYATFIPQTTTQGAEPPTPPSMPPSSPHAEGGNPDVMKRLQERHERMYGKTEE